MRSAGLLLRAVLLVAVATATTVAPAAAGPHRAAQDGAEVTGEELRQLAGEAVDDPDALARLDQIKNVDGRPVDIGAALDGVGGTERAGRLRQLAGGPEPGGAGAGGTGPPSPPGPSGVDGDEARQAARRVLDQDKYQPTTVPRPFRGVLEWLGDRLEPVFDPVGRFLTRVVDHPVGAVTLALVVALAAGVLGRILVGRRGRAAVPARHRDVGGFRDDDPAELEAAALTAEAEGQLDRALRLRFRAGLLALDRAGAVRYRSSLTAGEVGRHLRSPTFDGLAGTFDEVAYGGRRAGPADLDAAKREWPELLAATRSRARSSTVSGHDRPREAVGGRGVGR